MKYRSFLVVLVYLLPAHDTMAQEERHWPTVNELKGIAFVCGSSVGEEFKADRLNFSFEEDQWKVIGESESSVRQETTNNFLRDVIAKDALVGVINSFQRNYLDCVSNLVLQFKSSLLDNSIVDANITWESFTYDFGPISENNPDSLLASPSKLIIAYPKDWSVQQENPNESFLITPTPTSPFAGYAVSIHLDITDLYAFNIYDSGELANIDSSEFPVSPSDSGYNNHYAVDRSVDQSNGLIGRYATRKDTIKVRNDGGIEEQNIIFGFAYIGGNLRQSMAYSPPIDTYDPSGPQMVNSFFLECESPITLRKICDRFYERVQVEAATAMGD